MLDGRTMKPPAGQNDSIHEQLITRRELAKLCKVSTRTVDNWVATKRIPVLRGPSERCVRFSWSEVLKSLRSAEEGSCK
ncbi:MAG: DNA-binding protein [Cyclobacteriaceae bacterium]|nr:DNA-binding protein [Cyclobacteriaceae bacterium]